MILCLGEGIDVRSYLAGSQVSQKEPATTSCRLVTSDEPNRLEKAWRASGFLQLSLFMLSWLIATLAAGEGLRRGHANREGRRFGSGVCETRAGAGGADRYGDRRCVRTVPSWWVKETQQLNYERRFNQLNDVSYNTSSTLARSGIFLRLGFFYDAIKVLDFEGMHKMYVAIRFGTFAISMVLFFIAVANKDAIITLVSTSFSQCGLRCLPSIERLTTGVLISFVYTVVFFVILMPIAIIIQVVLSKVIVVGRWLKVNRRTIEMLSKSGRADRVVRRSSALMSPWAVRDCLFSFLFLIAWWFLLWNNDAANLSANGKTLLVEGHLTSDGFRFAVFYSIVSCATVFVFLMINYVIDRAGKSSQH